MEPSAEQKAIIEAADIGESFIVEALAGAGKTTTLRLLAEAYPDKHFLYVVFNKKLQEEADRKMPKNVKARTGDSLSWTFVSKVYKSNGLELHERLINSKGVYLNTNKEIAEHFDIKNYKVVPRQNKRNPAQESQDQKEEQLTIFQTISHIKKAIDKFCVSEATEIDTNHFSSKYTFPPEAVQDANKIWDDIKSMQGRMKISFTHIAKLWAITNPDLTRSDKDLTIKYDAILIDEAQDTNPVFGKVYRSQSIPRIYVGDKNQAIYQFRGAEDELRKVDIKLRLPLVKSWRFGPNIALAANKFLKMLRSENLLEGGSSDPGKVVQTDTMDDPDVIICRTNAGVLRAIFARLKQGKPTLVSADYKKDLLHLLESLAWLYGQVPKKPRIMHSDLENYDTRSELEAAIEANEESKKIVELAQMIEQEGYPQLVERLSKLTAHKKTGAIEIITAHRAKGSEWPKVRIYDDFWGYRLNYQTGEMEPPSDEELNLAYVAVTRAQSELDLGSLDYINRNPSESV